MSNKKESKIKNAVKFAIIIYTIIIIFGSILFILGIHQGIYIIVLAYIGIIITFILQKIPSKKKSNDDKTKNK